jgi:hypothetical protein
MRAQFSQGLFKRRGILCIDYFLAEGAGAFRPLNVAFQIKWL